MYISRTIIDSLIQWKSSKNRKPLLLQGARQIGKTMIMREFGRMHFDNVVEINFDRDKELVPLFERTKDPQRLINELSLLSSKPISPEHTLLIFDEIQECEAALNSLKYFRENALQYAIIAAGSLLGVAVRKKHMTVPVGQVHTLQMYPISFQEFLRTANKQLFDYVENIISLKPLPDIVLSQLIEEFRRYIVCGGMPEAVVALLENEGMDTVDSILSDILQLYQIDFSKYATPVEVSRIGAIWQSLPSQLSKENRKFLYSVIKTGARAREYEDALTWLEVAGLVYKIYCISKPYMPLDAYRELSAFKVYAFDGGLLRRLAHLSSKVVVNNDERFTEFRGALAENTILQSLVSQFKIQPCYWNSGNQAEIDFLVEYNDNIIPVEVKSGTRISGTSLAVYNNKYNPMCKIRYSLNNIQYNNGLLNIPIPLADWTKRLLSFISI